MGTELPSGECLEIDMTPSYELGNRNEDKIEPERIQELLDKGYQVKYNEEDHTYSLTTYLQGEKYEVELPLFRLSNGGINESILLKGLVSKIVGGLSDKVFNGLIEKYGDAMIVSLLFSEYKDSKYLQYGILSDDTKRDNNISPHEFLQGGINHIREAGVKYGYSQNTIEALKSTTPESVLQEFQNIEFEKFLDTLESNKNKSFDERRGEYLRLQKEKGKSNICDYIGVELEKLNGEIQLNTIEYIDNGEEISELLKFLDENGFKKNFENDEYVSSSGRVRLTFSLDNYEGKLRGLIEIIDSPSGPHKVNLSEFVQVYSKNKYTYPN